MQLYFGEKCIHPIQAHVVEYWSPAGALLEKVIEHLGKLWGFVTGSLSLWWPLRFYREATVPVFHFSYLLGAEMKSAGPMILLPCLPSI